MCFKTKYPVMGWIDDHEKLLVRTPDGLQLLTRKETEEMATEYYKRKVG